MSVQTSREFLFSVGLTKAPVGRGRFSAEAHAALAAARAKGTVFSDDGPKSAPATAKAGTVKKPKPVVVANTKAKAKAVDPKAVREWAKDNGYTVGERGRIHASIVEAYLADVPAEKQVEREDEMDMYRDSAARTYSDDTRFEGTYTYKGEERTLSVSVRAACMNCRTSLMVCRCGNPTVVSGHGGDGVQVHPIV